MSGQFERGRNSRAQHWVCVVLLWQTCGYCSSLLRGPEPEAWGADKHLCEALITPLSSCQFLLMRDKATQQLKTTICLVAFVPSVKGICVYVRVKCKCVSPCDWPFLFYLPLLSLLPQVSLSSSMLDVYGGEQGMNAPNDGMSPTSNPTKLTVKREYTGMNSYHSTD